MDSFEQGRTMKVTIAYTEILFFLFIAQYIGTISETSGINMNLRPCKHNMKQLSPYSVCKP